MTGVRSADPVFWNNLHNKDFWEEMPALVKDGAAFLQVRFWLSEHEVAQTPGLLC